ncbi:MAG: GTPase HflX, partial [Sphingopyxis sp.]
MIDSEDEVTRGAPALIVVPEWHSQRLARDLDARAEEARGLALAIGLDVVAVHT